MNVGAAIILAIAGVACAAYGLKFVFSETKMRFHFLWFALAIVLVAPLLLMAAGAWDTIPVALHWIVALSLLLFVIFELAFGSVISQHYNDRGAANLDYVVVLGAQVLDGKPGCTFARRLDTALAYLLENPHTQAIICGGQGSNESVPEAYAGREYLIERGIAAERILMEMRSRNTAQNLRFAAELIDPAHNTVGIVSNDSHMARCLFLARKVGIKHACGIAVKSLEHFPLNGIVRESFAWIKDILSKNA